MIQIDDDNENIVSMLCDSYRSSVSKRRRQCVPSSWWSYVPLGMWCGLSWVSICIATTPETCLHTYALCYSNDQDEISATSLQECIGACDARGNMCAGISWVPSRAGAPANGNPGYTCYLKSSVPANIATRQTFEVDTLIRVSNDLYYSPPTVPSCGASGQNLQTYITSDGSQWVRIRSTCRVSTYVNDLLIFDRLESM